jgi:hypothetical protein
MPNDFDNFVVGDTLTKSCIIKQKIFDEEIKLYYIYFHLKLNIYLK